MQVHRRSLAQNLPCNEVITARLGFSKLCQSLWGNFLQWLCPTLHYGADQGLLKESREEPQGQDSASADGSQPCPEEPRWRRGRAGGATATGSIPTSRGQWSSVTSSHFRVPVSAFGVRGQPSAELRLPRSLLGSLVTTWKNGLDFV